MRTENFCPSPAGGNSLNNFFTINEVLEKVDPMVFRYYLLQNHYSTPFNFSFDDLLTCEKSYRKIVNFFLEVNEEKSEDSSHSNEYLKNLEDIKY
mgnify:CR=1 FL=1